MLTPGSSPGGPSACRGRRSPRRSPRPGTSLSGRDMAVDWGLAHRDLTNIEARRRRALAPPRATLPDVGLSDHGASVCCGSDANASRDIGGHWFGAARSAALYFVCSDMWKPYLKVVAERAGQAVRCSPAMGDRCARPRTLPASSPPRAGRRCSSTAAGPAQASGESHRRAGGTARSCVATWAQGGLLERWQAPQPESPRR